MSAFSRNIPQEFGWYWLKDAKGKMFPAELTTFSFLGLPAETVFQWGSNTPTPQMLQKSGFWFGPKIEHPE